MKIQFEDLKVDDLIYYDDIMIKLNGTLKYIARVLSAKFHPSSNTYHISVKDIHNGQREIIVKGENILMGYHNIIYNFGNIKYENINELKDEYPEVFI